MYCRLRSAPAHRWQLRQVASSEYGRALIRNDQERLHLRGLRIAGASSKPAASADGRVLRGAAQQNRPSNRCVQSVQGNVPREPANRDVA